jgi:hypothetical protein
LRDAAASPRGHGLTFIYNYPKFLRETFVGIQTAYQVVLDQAIADLGAGKGDKYLRIAKDRLESRLVLLVDSAKDKRNQKTETQFVAITRSEFSKKGGKYLDFFAKGKAARERTVNFNFYDRKMLLELASEKELSFGRIFEIRSKQVQVLEQVYGLEKDEEGNLTPEAQENQAALADPEERKDQVAIPLGLRLESDSDWRNFLLAKFNKHKNQSNNPAEALNAVIKLLQRYLRAFTTHSPYNIDDFGEDRDNYLTRQFPRALTGQLIHDCGVYALRIAYMLSLLREELQLRFRFMALPEHVGLIITGKDLPSYIAHNNTISIFSAADMAKLSEEWVKTDPRGGPRTPTSEDKEQVLQELAGHQFIPGVDLPFQLLEAPRPTGDPDAMKREMWAFYTQRVVWARIFGPAIENPRSPLYQLDLKYLNVLTLMKMHHNQHLVPFWSKNAPEIWSTHKDGLSAALARLKATEGDGVKSAASFDELVKKYKSAIEPKFDVVNHGYEPVRQALKEISDLLAAHPEAIPQGVSRTHSARFAKIKSPPWWKHDFDVHLDLLNKREHLDKVRKQEVWAPFAEPDSLSPID